MQTTTKTNQITAQDLTGIMAAIVLMSNSEWIECFGNQLGNHYIAKMKGEYKGDFLRFFFYLDRDSVQTLINFTSPK